ncbi:hypothetical protein A2780_03755 [Candidatus Daviesbacteria bacterium RIFCSPHIGHO2_01_FULL_41_45]|uniref:Transcriptional repressor PaaX-like central Cas2-like domain-containing protein n=1 Tax=Candidatus Daviesbacteria bacterium RIFCSPLOWO2_01_FULL_40_24 TaxID=1797787 RepID=A0A1F5MID4_9BACT|nr:MAG: hypothetical protein A2780_03755 [Candidatus Daviesbacteria bacterium RIFCSPHIGHO2_01_FULL_41_45]OGE65123.1 MAG: hypothetical protein A3B49_03075 [Candidatus Daviesbacteria bacterium RIFCSPLOWO2_01_FULL_40_24]
MTEKQKEVAKTIVLALGIVGVVSLVAVAPGLGKIIPLLQKVDTRRINQEIKRLYKRGLVEIIKRKNGVEEIRLTKKGKAKLVQYNIDQLKVEKPQKWDGKWRVVIFDIPVTKNQSRELLRRKMKQLGFYKLQNSVFVHPYPCLEIVEFIREYFGVKAEVEYIEADNLESQNKLINHFFV